jgi:DNA polymerase III subunit epsilon
MSPTFSRQIVLDTETTGLSPKDGHRIIEIGCIELINRRLTRNQFHVYINPQRVVDAEAVGVHGITNEFLQDKPPFAQIAHDFLNFIHGAQLLIHNAPFDVGFINHEFSLLGNTFGALGNYCAVFDTLALAREKHPGQRNSLDALCRRYNIDNSHRELHGALLDAEILADVYLAMTGGQATLIGENKSAANSGENAVLVRRVQDRAALKVIYPNELELAEHQQRLEAIDKASKGLCLWKNLT